MKKPSSIVFKLGSIGWIHGLHIEQKQTGTDTAEPFCKITGSNGKCEGQWSSYERFLDVRVGHNYVAKLKAQFSRELSDWELFEKENAKELAEYERLKAKFEK